MLGCAKSGFIVFTLTSDAHTARTLPECGNAAKPQTALCLHSSFGQLMETEDYVLMQRLSGSSEQTKNKDLDLYVEI